MASRPGWPLMLHSRQPPLIAKKPLSFYCSFVSCLLLPFSVSQPHFLPSVSPCSPDLSLLKACTCRIKAWSGCFVAWQKIHTSATVQHFLSVLLKWLLWSLPCPPLQSASFHPVHIFFWCLEQLYSEQSPSLSEKEIVIYTLSYHLFTWAPSPFISVQSISKTSVLKSTK